MDVAVFDGSVRESDTLLAGGNGAIDRVQIVLRERHIASRGGQNTGYQSPGSRHALSGAFGSL